MKKMFAIVAICLAMSGCASTSDIQSPLVDTLAFNAGYIGYRAVPEARSSLAAICLLTTQSNQAILQAQLKELLGMVWVEADKLTDADAQVIILALNNLWGIIQLKASSLNLDQLKAVASGVCNGVGSASKVL